MSRTDWPGFILTPSSYVVSVPVIPAFIVPQDRITPEKKIRSLIHHEKRALGKGRKNQSTIATSTYKNTSPLARAENPKVQRPSEVSWSYLYLATSSSAITRVEFILPKKNQARVGHELKNKKKSEPLNPFWGGTGRAHHPLRYLCWWSYVWDVICWFGIGMVQSACHALVGITVTFIFCGARDETSCLMCTV